MENEQNQNQPAMNEAAIIGKMSVKALGCNPKIVAAKDEGDNSPEKMCVIFGTANGTKTWEDKRNGQIYSCLVGDFKGINLRDGKTYRSGKLFLPGGIHETVENAVNGDGTGNDNVVEFALEIQAVKANNPIGYSYQGIPRIKAQKADPLDRLESMVRGMIELPAPALQQIAAPAAPAAPVAPAAPAAPATPAAVETAPQQQQQRSSRRR